MKALKSKYFSIVLQILSFFKYQTKYIQQQVSDAIKQMHVEQLYHNIINDKFDTILIRDILIFLLSKVHNKKFEKYHIAGANHFLMESLDKHREIILENYYASMAIQEYFCLIDEEQNQHDQYQGIYNFCELKQDLKFKILSMLVRNASESVGAESKMKKQQKIKQSEEDKKSDEKSEQKNEENKTKKINYAQQISVLGQDNKYVYFYAPFIPNYVLTYYMGNWDTLDKYQIVNKIKQLLNKQKSTSNLFLCQSLQAVLQKYIKHAEQSQHSFQLKKIEQIHSEMKAQRLTHLRSQLLKINQRYCNYLHKFNNRCWGYLKQRQHYVHKVMKAQSIDHLIEAFRQFYLVSYHNIYICQCDDQMQIPQSNCHEFYQTQVRQFCNINTVTVKLRSDFAISSSEITLKIIQEAHADKYALFQLNVLILNKSMDFLDEKQRRYYSKLQKREKSLAEKSSFDDNQKKQYKAKQLRQRDRKVRYSQNSLSSLNSLRSKNSKQSLPKIEKNLRQKKQTKKFGVTMIDSDQSEEQYVNSKSSKNFEQYHYKKSKCVK